MRDERATEPESREYQLIVSYLLGELSPEERQQIEDRYFADPDFLEQIDSVEGDLLTDYVHGSLPREKTEKVERQLLNSPRQRQKVEAAADLLRVIKQREANESSQSDLIKATPRGRKAVRFPFLRLQLVWPVIALLLVAGWFVDRISLRRQLEHERNNVADLRQVVQEQQELIAQKEESANDTEPPSPQATEKDAAKEEGPNKPSRRDLSPDIATFLLVPPETRTGENPPMELTIPAQTKIIRLELLYRGKSFQTYQAELENADGGEVKALVKVQPRDRKNTIAVEIQAVSLGNGTYTLKIYAQPGDKEVGLYNFRIKHR